MSTQSDAAISTLNIDQVGGVIIEGWVEKEHLAEDGSPGGWGSGGGGLGEGEG